MVAQSQIVVSAEVNDFALCDFDFRALRDMMTRSSLNSPASRTPFNSVVIRSFIFPNITVFPPFGTVLRQWGFDESIPTALFIYEPQFLWSQTIRLTPNVLHFLRIGE